MLDPTEKSFLLSSMNVLGQELMQQAHDAQGHLLSKTQHSVTISDPEMRRSVQAKLDHAVNLLAIANIMAIFEHHLPLRFWDKVYNDPSLTMQLRAFRHMQYSSVYGFTRVRASQNKEDFNRMYEVDVKPNWIANLSADELFLQNGAAAHVIQVVQTAWQRGIVAIHKI